MTNRAMAIVPRIVLAGVVASAAATTLHVRPTIAAEDCLAKPKGVAPSGQHWYYRSDRATKRQCWYLDDIATHGASLSERKSAPVHRRREMPQEAADAHAEFPSPTASASAVKREVASAAPSAVPAGPLAALPDESSAPSEPVRDSFTAAADQSSLAARWPDPAGVVPAPEPASSLPSGTASSYAIASAEPPATTTAEVDTSAASAPAALSASDTATAEVPAVTATIDSSRTRLAVFLGAVALAGFSTSVLLARARARRRIRLEPVIARRRHHWPADAELDDMQLPDVVHFQPVMATRDERPSRRAAQVSIVPRDDVHYDEQYEIEDLLSRFGGQGRSMR